jgi:hypothetical protein
VSRETKKRLARALIFPVVLYAWMRDMNKDTGYGKENQRVRGVDLEKDAKDFMDGEEN